MHSEESYATAGNRSRQFGLARATSSTAWSGSQTLADAGSLYGKFNLVSSGTWGDGDAAGFTLGSERRTAVEDAYLLALRGAAATVW